MAIRILHIFMPNLTSRFSGDAIWWKNIFDQWEATDGEHYVLDCKKNKIVTSQEAFDFEYSGIQKRISRWQRAVWILELFRSLIEHKGQYDILHVHVIWWGGLLIGPWAKWNGIPAMYESVLLNADTPGGMLKGKLGRVKVRCLKSYRAILAISEYLSDDYRKYGFTKNQIFTLVHCVMTDLYFPAQSIEKKIDLRNKLTLPSGATILVFVGSVIERKGVDVLIQAFIDASINQPDLFLIIVGPKSVDDSPSIDEDFVNHLYSLLNKNNLNERVFITGLIQDRQKLSEIYRASDIFVFPSNNEGLGNVVLEAMASGLPVVVS